MNEQEARALAKRIQPELPEGFTAWAGYRLFSPNWHVVIRAVQGRKPFPDIHSYRQWRTNRHKLEAAS